MESAPTILTLLFSTIVNHLPFLLWGILISSLIATSNLHRLWAGTIANAGPIKQILWGCILGLILPLGRYGNVIVARQLWFKRIPLAMVISFFFASVTLNPISLWLHRKAFADHLGIVLWELGFVLMVAIVMGVIFLYSPPSEALSPNDNIFRGGTPPLTAPKNHGWNNRISITIDHCLRELWELGGIFLLGCLVVSLCQLWFPFPKLLAIPGPPLAQIFQGMVAGLLSGVSPWAGSFVAADWALLVTKGTTIAFLMVTGWFDLATMGLMAYLIKPKPFLYLIIIPLNLTLVLNLILDYTNY